MLLQAIVIDDRAYEVEKASRSFIRTHIFPGGCLPSLEVIARCVARHTDMRAVGLKDLDAALRRDAATLARQLRGRDRGLEDLGYDERFRRLWRMYLAYCEAGFTERRIGVMQMTLAKPEWRRYAGPTNAYEAPRALASKLVETLKGAKTVFRHWAARQFSSRRLDIATFPLSCECERLDDLGADC